MTTTSYWRGHTIYPEKGEWFYSDTRTPTIGTDRPCGFCNREKTKEDHDGCLGTLPGVENACCGHGQDVDAYIWFENGKRFQGKKAIRMIRTLQQKRDRNDN